MIQWASRRSTGARADDARAHHSRVTNTSMRLAARLAPTEVSARSNVLSRRREMTRFEMPGWPNRVICAASGDDRSPVR